MKRVKIRRTNKNKYDLGSPQDSSDRHSDVSDKIDKLLNVKKLSEENPLERAIKFDYVKRSPPKSGYNQVDVHEGIVKDPNGDDEHFVVSKSDDNGKEIHLVHDPFRVVDLKTSIEADVARAPSHITPMLIDEYSKIAVDDEKEFTRLDKGREPFKYWWVILILLMLPGIILVILMFA